MPSENAIPAMAQPVNGAALVRARSKFFFGMSIVLLLLILSGFAPTLYLRAFFDVPPIPSHLYLHGSILTGWFVWMVVQTSLVQTGPRSGRSRLGRRGRGGRIAGDAEHGPARRRGWRRPKCGH